MLFIMTAQQYYHFLFLCFLKFPRSNATGKKTKKPKDRILSTSGFIPEETLHISPDTKHQHHC